ncbi:MAG TPA: hypothetical protein PLQ93_09395 [Bacteroidia bacterium]|nr:hypothetical protein [Bacteroidia bacterium]
MAKSKKSISPKQKPKLKKALAKKQKPRLKKTQAAKPKPKALKPKKAPRAKKASDGHDFSPEERKAWNALKAELKSLDDEHWLMVKQSLYAEVSLQGFSMSQMMQYNQLMARVKICVVKMLDLLDLAEGRKKNLVN